MVSRVLARDEATGKDKYIIVSDPLFTKTTVLVPSTSTVIVDSVDKTSFLSIKYSFLLYNKTIGVRRYFDFTVVNFDTTSQSSMATVIGDSIDFELNDSIVGGNLEVEIVNNESYDLTIEFVKLVMG